MFKGMKCYGSAHCSEIWPKLLGTYELELRAILEKVCLRDDVTIVDVGAAEGYYAVGFLFLNPSANVVAFELTQKGQQATQELALTNGVQERLKILGECHLANLSEVLKSAPNAFVLMGVKGAEFSLLDPEAISGLRACEILVESHDSVNSQICLELLAKFSTTHSTTIIPARRPRGSEIKNILLRNLLKVTPAIAKRLLHERRPGMNWAHFMPLATTPSIPSGGEASRYD
jgi:hypothetical protein